MDRCRARRARLAVASSGGAGHRVGWRACGRVSFSGASPLRLDLRDFFASISAARVFGIFRALGYTPHVAHTLTSLCTNVIPAHVWNAMARPQQPRLIQPHFWLGRRLATPHLPQGAPTSPALANLAAFGLDRRLEALGLRFGLRYSRYADDLTFSGSRMSAGANRALLALAARVTRAEGFRVHDDKSILRSAAQRQIVTGVVVNERLNAPREDYDRLRATLHRLAVRGVDSCVDGEGDLQAQLRGQVAWMSSLNPSRGEKLRRLFDAVVW